eukprot:1147523-Pelagomonas_calceolata.AAC.1
MPERKPGKSMSSNMGELSCSGKLGGKPLLRHTVRQQERWQAASGSPSMRSAGDAASHGA